MLKMTFGALVAAGLFLVSAGALARPSSLDRYDRVGRPGSEQVRESRTERTRHQHVRHESRTTSRAPATLDTRRNRGELWGDEGSRSRVVTRSEQSNKARANGQGALTRRQSQVSNCSEYANCGGSSDGSTAKKSSSSSKNGSSAQEAYKRKVWMNWAKQFEKKYMPAKATTAEDFLP